MWGPPVILSSLFFLHSLFSSLSWPAVPSLMLLLCHGLLLRLRRALLLFPRGASSPRARPPSPLGLHLALSLARNSCSTAARREGKWEQGGSRRRLSTAGPPSRTVGPPSCTKGRTLTAASGPPMSMLLPTSGPARCRGCLRRRSCRASHRRRCSTLPP
jgi:hypothetical protein